VIGQSKKNTLILAAILAWIFAAQAAWQAWLPGWQVPRFIAGCLLFLVPGILTYLAVWAEDKVRPGYLLLSGLVISIAGAGLLGALARGLAVNFGFIRWGMTLWGLLGLLILLPRRAVHLEFERPPLWVWFAWAGAGLCVAFLAGLAMPPLIHDDGFSYNALLYYFQHAGSLTFDFPEGLSRLEIPRFWIAYWPLVEALISSLSGIDGLLLTGLFISPLLVAFSALAIYELARGLGAGRGLALVAVLGQAISLMRLTRLNQPGSIFFYHLTEDKAVAAFVLAPILILYAVEYLAQPTAKRLILVAVAALAMVFTHPVIFGMACLILGVYSLLSLVGPGLRREYVFLIGLLALIVLIPYSFRFGGGAYQQSLSFSLRDVIEHGELSRFGIRRVDLIEGTSFYGISHYLAVGFPYEAALLSSLVAVFFFAKDRLARLTLAAFLVLAVAMWPYTGWLIGALTSPFQLWRLTWMMPFGLAFAFLADAAGQAALRLAPGRPRFGPVIQGVLLASLAGGMLYLIPWASGNLQKGNVDLNDLYSNYLAVGQRLNGLPVEGPVIVGGPDTTTNSILPSLTLRFDPLVFRVESGGEQTLLWRSIFGDDIPTEERLTRLEANQVEYLLIKGDLGWVRDLAAAGQLEAVFHVQRFSLYRLLR
jgi:hypothetical protein